MIRITRDHGIQIRLKLRLGGGERAKKILLSETQTIKNLCKCRQLPFYVICPGNNTPRKCFISKLLLRGSKRNHL